jgi:putative PIN family toxin of toxin-antitoxin system
MSEAERLVLDTNVVLSGLLFSGSKPRAALLKAQKATILASDETLAELIEVMGRPRFQRYVELGIRQRLLAEYIKTIEKVEIYHSIRACRDPKDDKFLELAVDGRADAIVTGDSDLLALHPFRGIAILTPADYLKSP